VDADQANARIADTGFEVARAAPGKAILSLTCVHYTDTDCGEYEEIAMGFFVEKPGHQARRVPYLGTWSDVLRSRVGSYTWALQVTTVLSQQAGLQMWGFPKTVEEIDFERTQDRACFTLRMGGEEVLRYSVRAQGRQQPAPTTSPVYSIYEGAQHVGHLRQHFRDVGVRPGGGRLELGSHPLARQLHDLGLRRRPLIATWMGHLDFSMSAPEKL